MADLLIKYLKKKGEESSSSKLLVSQWVFDEELIPKALQNIGGLFPHYSRHDESHSRQILINIERILGEEGVARLSATDIWLLLESAYWHDIGMVVSKRDKNSFFHDEGFLEYLNGICGDPHHDLCSLANGLRSGGNWMTEGDTPIQTVERIQLLVSEWVRRKHPERAELIVKEPARVIGLSSPRTELIPSRIFGLLGRICKMHGSAFDEIINKEGGLPFKQAGVGLDDCHPRFVACLLRLGDLLDLDNNRFCPVMQCVAGDDRPALSKAHEDKHSAITYFRADRDRIEVKAECQTIEGYIETCKWFQWLRDEIRYQMAHWQDIVPSRELGLLPTLGDLSVGLSGDLKVLESGISPRFSIDAKMAFELLRGSNLYKKKYDSVREILQNAVDSTLIKSWVESRGFMDQITDPAKCREFLEDEPVCVRFYEELDEHHRSRWFLEVSDSGTGISQTDLPYMMAVGASQNNKRRQSIISSMPDWMRPSGCFGIGLQSVFMITDSINIESKDLFAGESLVVKMESPTSASNGVVMIKGGRQDFFKRSGVKILLEINNLDKGKPYVGDEVSVRSAIASGYDPLMEDGSSYDVAGIADQILMFSKGSLVPIKFSMKTLARGILDDEGFSDQTADLSLSSFDYIKMDEGLLGISYKIASRDKKANIYDFDRKNFYFRGQPIARLNLSLPFFEFSINVMFGSARDWLSANRSDLLEPARNKVLPVFFSALEIKISEDIESFDSLGKEQKILTSMFLAYMAYKYGGRWIELSNKVGDEWFSSTVFGGAGSKLLSRKRWIVGDAESYNNKPDFILKGEYSFLKPVVFSHWIKRGRNSVTAVTFYEAFPRAKKDDAINRSLSILESFSEERFKGLIFYKMSNGPGEICTEKALATRINERMTLGSQNERYLVPFISSMGEWAPLQLKSSINLGIKSIFPEIPYAGPMLLLPYLFAKRYRSSSLKLESGGYVQLAIFLKDKIVGFLTVEEIVVLLKSFVVFFDNIMSASEFQEDWLVKRVLKEN